MKEEKNDKAQMHNVQQGQQPYKYGQNKEESGSSAQQHDRKQEEELLTTGGPVDRSAVEGNADNGVSNENIDMSKDENSNPEKGSSLEKPTRGRSARYGTPEEGINAVSGHLYREDEDTSSDKTEGIVNPRTTQEDWSKFKSHSEKAGEEQDSSEQ